MAPKTIRKASALETLIADVERADAVAPVPAGFPSAVEAKPKTIVSAPKTAKAACTLWLEERIAKALRVEAAVTGAKVSHIVAKALESYIAESGEEVSKITLAG